MYYLDIIHIKMKDKLTYIIKWDFKKWDKRLNEI